MTGDTTRGSSLLVAETAKAGDVISISSHWRISGGLEVARFTVSMGGFEVSGSTRVAGVLTVVGAVDFGDSISVAGTTKMGSSVSTSLEALVERVSAVESWIKFVDSQFRSYWK